MTSLWLMSAKVWSIRSLSIASKPGQQFCVYGLQDLRQGQVVRTDILCLQEAASEERKKHCQATIATLPSLVGQEGQMEPWILVVQPQPDVDSPAQSSRQGVAADHS